MLETKLVRLAYTTMKLFKISILFLYIVAVFSQMLFLILYYFISAEVYFTTFKFSLPLHIVVHATHICLFFPAPLSSFPQFSELLHRAKAGEGIEGASVAGGLANCT